MSIVHSYGNLWFSGLELGTLGSSHSEVDLHFTLLMNCTEGWMTPFNSTDWCLRFAYFPHASLYQLYQERKLATRTQQLAFYMMRNGAWSIILFTHSRFRCID